jgi:hypothetical protein
MTCLRCTEDNLDAAEVPNLNCTVCGKPLDLRTAHSDDYGKPVHSECYAFSTLKPPDSE